MKQIIYTADVGFVLFNASDYLKYNYYELLRQNFHFNQTNNFNNKEEMLQIIKLDLIDKINNYYEIKYNEDYNYLILLIENNQFEELKINLNNTNYNMKNYILNAFSNYM